jgi:CheY-like chemotaxis protein
MSTPIPDLQLSERRPPPIKKKRVLLVDNSRAKRDLRAEIMRKLGMEVDCAADISEARTWWRADLYNLVLIRAENEHGRRDKFCEDIRAATPPQQVTFLVGKPEYLADSPHPDAAVTASEDCGQASLDEVKSALASHDAANPSQSWGILEACRRISVVRSASDARTRAIRQRPDPPRDSETSKSQKTAENSEILAESSKEEMQ